MLIRSREEYHFEIKKDGVNIPIDIFDKENIMDTEKDKRYVVGENFSTQGEQEKAEFVRPVGEYFLRVFEANKEYESLTEEQVKKLRLPESFVGKSLDWDTVSELNLDESGFDQIWKEVMWDLCKDLAVHGNYKDGSWLLFTDMDGYGAKFLMEREGIRGKYKDKDDKKIVVWNFIAKGGVFGPDEGVSAINVDTSRTGEKGKERSIEGSWLDKITDTDKEGSVKTVYVLMLDHHAPHSTDETSATRTTYEALCAMGMMERNESLDRWVKVITKIDNGLPLGDVPKNFGGTPRQYFQKHYAETVWGANAEMGEQRAEKLKKFLDKGGDPMKVLTSQEKKELGLVYRKGKTKNAPEVNKCEQIQQKVDKAMLRIGNLEKTGMVRDIPGVGKVVVDMGGEMGLLGFEASRACGYDAYLAWNPDRNSFVLNTKDKLGATFDMGIKVRDHMWMLSEKMEQKLEISLDDFLKKLSEDTLKGQEGRRNEELKDKLVWYPEMLDDLRLVTYLDGELDKDESESGWKASRKRLEDKGVKLPALSINEDNQVENGNRIKLRSAVDFLRNKEMQKSRYWGSRKKAIEYLNSLGISEEEKVGVTIEKKKTVLAKIEVKPKEITVKEVGADLIKLTELAEDSVRLEEVLSTLETAGVKIREVLNGLEKQYPGKKKDILQNLRASVEIWKMYPKKRTEFPEMTRRAQLMAEWLGVKMV